MANTDFIAGILGSILKPKKQTAEMLGQVAPPAYSPVAPVDTPRITPAILPPPTAPAIDPLVTPEDRIRELQDPMRYKQGGAGRNEKWSTWEKIGAALAGWAGGGLAGGVKAATDRNFFNKMGDQNELNRLIPAVQTQEAIRKSDAEDAFRTAQTQAAEMAPILKKDEQDRKVEKDKNDLKLRTDTLDWKKEDRDKYFELENLKQRAVETKNTKLYDLAVRKQTELERYNGVKDENADLDRKSREGIAGERIKSAEGIANSRISNSNAQLEKKLAASDDKTKRSLVANSLARWKAQNKRATPEQIAAAEEQIRATVFR